MRLFIKNSKQNRIKNYFSIFISLSIILSFLNPVIVASAASAESVSITSDSIGQNDTAHVVISIENSVNVTGMDLTLVYETSVVSLSTVSSNTSDVSGHTVSHTDTAGTVTIEIRQLDNLTSSSPVPLIDLTFDAVAGGSTILDLQSIQILEEGEASSVPGTIADGSITVDSAPVLDPIGDRSATEGKNLNFTISATDDDGDDVSYSATDLPPGANLNPSTGYFSWTPGSSSLSSYDVTFIATANTLEDSETITISVTNVDQPPVLDPIGDRSATEGKNLNFTISATDDDGDDVSYSATDLPPGANLNPSTGYFSWTPGSSSLSSYDVTFIATANTLEDSETITISVTNVDQPPVLDPIGDRSATEGKNLNFTISATDDDGDDVSYSATDLPPGANLNPSTGYFSWTPGSSSLSSYDVTFIATANTLEDSETITISVTNVDQPPVLDPIGDRSATEGKNLNFTISATDDDGDDVSYSATDLPPGANLNPSTGYFSWTPGSSSLSSYDVTFIATANTLEDSETITISVTNVDQPPVLDPIGDRSATEGKNLNFTISATDDDGDDVSYSATDLPPGANLNPSTGYFSWTPGSSSLSSYDVTFIATANTLEDSETITISVTNVDQPPVLDPIGDRSATEGKNLNFTISATDDDGDDVSYSATDLPPGANLNPSTGYFSWTPGSSSLSSYDVTFIATANTLEDSETITISVTNVDQPPVLDPIGDRSATEGKNLNFTISATDDDGDDVSYSATDLPPGANLNPSTGYFSWTPGSSSLSSYDVTFIATANTLEDSETITISVTNVDQPPVLDPIGDRSATEGKNLNFTISATDDDGDDVSYSATDLPPGANLNPSTGYFSWTPGSSSLSSYDVTFIATANTLEDSETITISVTNVDQPPVLDPIGDRSATEGKNLNFTISATDDDGDDVSYSATDLPPGANLNPSTGYFSWTPGSSSLSSYDVTFIATADTLEDSETITISVTNVDQPPVLDPIGDRSATEGKNLNFTISATDDDGDDVSYSATDLPPGANLNPSTGYFSWTPGSSSLSSYDVTFIATANTLEDSETITISVTNVDQPPVLDPIGDRSATEGKNLNFTISATDDDGDDVSYSATDLPLGANLNPSTGYFSWTPGSSSLSSYDVTFIATANTLEDSETLTISVTNVDQPPVLDPIGDRSATEGKNLNFTISATDDDGDDVSYSATDLPPGANLNPSTGYFSWTPGSSSLSSYDVTFIATANTLEDSETLTISVTNVDQPPVLDPIGDRSATEGKNLNFTISATDDDGDDVSYSATDLPPGANLNPSTGYFSWTPAYDSLSSYDVAFIATANGLTDSETITIAITNVDQVPVLDPIGDKTAYEGSPINFTIHATDDDGDTVTYDYEDLPGGATFDSTSGAFSWTPAYDGDEGDHVVKFIARANGKIDDETITITVNHVNRAPELDPIPSQSINETETVTIALTATDDDEGDSLSYTTNATVGDLTGNIFTWTPDYTHNGTHHISFTVSDGDLTDTEVATIGVNDQNAPPEFDPVGPQNVTEGSTLSFTVSATDVDENDVLTYSVPDQPEGSLVSFNSEGIIFSWTPDSEDAGNHSVTFKVSDSVYDDYLVVPIEVDDFNHAPEFTSLQPGYTVNESELLEITLGTSDEDNDSLEKSVNNTGNASGALLGDVYTWETGYHDSGIYEIEFAVSDGKNTTVQTTTVTVNDVNAPPVLTSIGSKSITEGSTLSFNLSATDVDNGTLTYSAENIPNGSVFNETTASFTWTTASGDAGTYYVLFNVSDGTDVDSETVTITVTTVSTGSSGGGGGSSSSSGGGGGGSAVGSGEKFENIELADYVLASVIKDAETVFTFKETNDIVSVRFTSKYNAGQVKTVVEMLKDTSTQVNSPAPGVVYKNINIYSDSTLPPDVLGNSMVDFKVEKSWVNANEVNVTNIVLCKYISGSWDKLPTVMTGEDEDYFYFLSTTPTFSQFAITSIDPSLEEDVHASGNTVSVFNTGNSLMSTDDSLELESEDSQTKSKSALPFVFVLILAGLGIIYWAIRMEQ